MLYSLLRTATTKCFIHRITLLISWVLMLGMLDLQKSFDKRLIFVILFWKFELLVFALKASIFAFELYFPFEGTLNVIGSLPLLIRYFVTIPKDS